MSGRAGDRAAAPRPRIPWRPLDGVLLADKPRGGSSNGFLQELRRLFRAEKGGHGGTLDPMATGLLVVCFGEATKFSSWLLESVKRYEGEITLGMRTSTADAEGEVIERADVAIDSADLAEVARRFTGTYDQRPPMYSALKFQGQPLYAYARKGVEVEVKVRSITVSELGLERIGVDRLRFAVVCSTGTYVRSLAEDLSAALGTVGHLSALRRTASGPFDVSGACTLEALRAMDEPQRDLCLLPVDRLPYALPRLDLEEDQARSLTRGQVVRLRGEGFPGRSRVYDPEGRFLGVGETTGEGVLRPVRLMATQPAGKTAEKLR
ncbi:MAG: tRNA pseudouridine(55) synthase TruB [Betaproteobacteria bacterium]|nr:tRNA pseudouridine(55) synthase TruB [Betaproteobacteria bacterium]